MQNIFICRHSAKNRRKAAHKKWKLKEGSQYEEFALIAALSKTITYTDNLRGILPIPYIGNFLRQEILARMMLGSCVKFSLSPILAISRTLNEDL